MSVDSSNNNTWRRLYEAAIRVKELAPSEWMFEDAVFGVQDPETGKLGFVSVMGQVGEHFTGLDIESKTPAHPAKGAGVSTCNVPLATYNQLLVVQRSHTWQHLAFEILQAGAAAGADVGHLVGQAGVVHRSG